MKYASLLLAVVFTGSCGCRGENNPNVKRARMGIKHLNEAVVYYHNNHSAWPPTLDVLTEPRTDGGEPYLEAHALQDPWGRPYEYDPTSTNPQTGHPLIWSEGPSPGEPGSKIANWDNGE